MCSNAAFGCVAFVNSGQHVIIPSDITVLDGLFCQDSTRRSLPADKCLEWPKMKDIPVLDKHVCPICNLKVHRICGEENGQAEGIKDITILLCLYQQGCQTETSHW